MDADSILILASPLLPARAYDPLAEALRQRGVDAGIASADMAAHEHAGDLIRRWAGLVGRRTALVPHSNAGYLAPSVRALSTELPPIVFMDAALPPEHGVTALAPPRLRTFLAGLADEHGLLPPWTRWWSRGELDAVVPDHLFLELDRACPRLPLSYFDFRLAAPSVWTAGPNAYLAFGATYADEIAVASARGWPHVRTEGAHLHFLRDPQPVATAILDLLTSVRLSTNAADKVR